MPNEDTTPRRPAPNRRRFLASVAAGVATVAAGGRVAASPGSNQSGNGTGRETLRVPDLTYFDVGDYEGVVLNDGLYPIPLPPDTATEFYFGDAPGQR
ncbi:twin-arginine translocation signal domain-containing protein [Halobacteriaceae archaeon GCM10025711]